MNDNEMSGGCSSVQKKIDCGEEYCVRCAV